jgi:hypothetical protein
VQLPVLLLLPLLAAGTARVPVSLQVPELVLEPRRRGAG